MNPPDFSKLPTRFWDKVEVNADTGCWEWQASTRGRGVLYGRYFLSYKRMVSVHRLAFIDATGLALGGMHVLHRCDNPICVYQKHLYLGTHQENMADRDRRGRAARGSRNGISKLVASQVIELRRLHATGQYTEQSLGTIYGVTRQSIHDILTGKHWSHIALHEAKHA